MKSQKNVVNSKNIKIGMDKDKVLEIMGLPEVKRGYGNGNKDSTYYYQPPFAASSGILIEFDSLGHVNHIQPFE